MPDDLAEVEQEFLARLALHQRRMENDPQYRQQWQAQQSQEQQPIFPVSAW